MDYGLLEKRGIKHLLLRLVDAGLDTLLDDSVGVIVTDLKVLRDENFVIKEEDKRYVFPKHDVLFCEVLGIRVASSVSDEVVLGLIKIPLSDDLRSGIKIVDLRMYLDQLKSNYIKGIINLSVYYLTTARGKPVKGLVDKYDGGTLHTKKMFIGAYPKEKLLADKLYFELLNRAELNRRSGLDFYSWLVELESKVQKLIGRRSLYLNICKKFNDSMFVYWLEREGYKQFGSVIGIEIGCNYRLYIKELDEKYIVVSPLFSGCYNKRRKVYSHYFTFDREQIGDYEKNLLKLVGLKRRDSVYADVVEALRSYCLFAK